MRYVLFALVLVASALQWSCNGTDEATVKPLGYLFRYNEKPYIMKATASHWGGFGGTWNQHTEAELRDVLSLVQETRTVLSPDSVTPPFYVENLPEAYDWPGELYYVKRKFILDQGLGDQNPSITIMVFATRVNNKSPAFKASIYLDMKLEGWDAWNSYLASLPDSSVKRRFTKLLEMMFFKSPDGGDIAFYIFLYEVEPVYQPLEDLKPLRGWITPDPDKGHTWPDFSDAKLFQTDPLWNPEGTAIKLEAYRKD